MNELRVDRLSENKALKTYMYLKNLLKLRTKQKLVRCCVSESADVESTYHMYVENSRLGIMKRSGMDIDLISDVQTLPIYSVSRVLYSIHTMSVDFLVLL